MLDPLVTVRFIVAPIGQMAAIAGLHALQRAYGQPGAANSLVVFGGYVTAPLLYSLYPGEWLYSVVDGARSRKLPHPCRGHPCCRALPGRFLLPSSSPRRCLGWAKRTEVLALATTVARQELRAVCSTFSTSIFLVVPAIAPVSSITTGVLNCASSKQQEVKINTNCLTSSSLTAFVRRVSLSCRPSSAKAGGETARR